MNNSTAKGLLYGYTMYAMAMQSMMDNIYSSMDSGGPYVYRKAPMTPGQIKRRRRGKLARKARKASRR